MLCTTWRNRTCRLLITLALAWHFIPKVTGHDLQLDMPSESLDDPNFLLSIGMKTLKGVILGNITSQQAKDLAMILDAQRKMTETVQIKPIIEEIEERIKNRK